MGEQTYEVMETGQRQLTAAESKPLTAEDIRAQVQLIQTVMAAVMTKDVHYGVIPGTSRPTLYKPGSEKILTTFRIAAYPKEVEDLSTSDTVHYRVKVHGISPSGLLVGVGVGECSSDEEKYKWRRPVCDEEYAETPEDRKRAVWKRDRSGKAYQQKQVRTNPADVANTILKMAKKRAQIDMTLTATAASDVFDQDLEDLPEGIVEATASQGHPTIKTPQRKAPATKNPPGKEKVTKQDQDPPGGEAPATEPQLKAINALLTKKGISDDFERHETVSKILGYTETIDSLGKLTKGEASKTIEALGKE